MPKLAPSKRQYQTPLWPQTAVTQPPAGPFLVPRSITTRQPAGRQAAHRIKRLTITKPSSNSSTNRPISSWAAAITMVLRPKAMEIQLRQTFLTHLSWEACQRDDLKRRHNSNRCRTTTWSSFSRITNNNIISLIWIDATRIAQASTSSLWTKKTQTVTSKWTIHTLTIKIAPLATMRITIKFSTVSKTITSSSNRNKTRKVESYCNHLTINLHKEALKVLARAIIRTIFHRV